MGISATVIVIQELEGNRFILRCARCKGTGVYSSPDPCRVCGGKGAVLVEIDGNTPFVKCARCNGTGVYSSPDPCRACKGTGAQPISGTMEIIK